MPNPVTDKIIREANANTFQQPSPSGGVFVVPYLVTAGLNVPPWWSPSRDAVLTNFWKKNDYLSGAIYTLESKLTAIPFSVQPYDPANKEHVADAEYFTFKLRQAAELGEGWTTFYGKFIESLLTQDNGVFAEIIGPGSVGGPLEGEPISVKFIDASFCIRTGNFDYPVVVREGKKSYKLHRSRVMYTSQMTSTLREMNGVGFCSVSRAINVAQSLLDILVFKQEKLGSRPHRQVLITHGGLDPQDLQNAFMMAEANMDAQGLQRYSKVVVAGSASLQEAGVDVIELSSLPDGFDEQTSVTLGMATIALAFGVDAKELFPSMSAGATRADALLQHIRQRGKAPGQILQITEDLFNYKFLPPHLHLVFDYQDDAEDRQVAEIKQIRANRNATAITSGTMDERTAREQMLEAGDLSRAQFDRLELADGRLPDGMPILTLFYSKDAKISKLLALEGIDGNLLDTTYNDAQAILDAVTDKLPKVYDQMCNGVTHSDRWLAQQAFYALEALRKLYEGVSKIDTQLPGETTAKDPTKPVFPGKQDTRLRVRAPLAESPADHNQEDDMQPASDDRETSLKEEGEQSPFLLSSQ